MSDDSKRLDDLYAAIAKELKVEVAAILNVGLLTDHNPPAYRALVALDDGSGNARRVTVEASKVVSKAAIAKAKQAEKDGS